MRKRLIGTLALVMAMTGMLLPLSQLLSRGQDGAQENDAQHVIEPMLRIMAQGPQACADVPVEPIVELEDAWAIEDARSEAEAGLVVGMRNGEDALGYDRGENTFYCTLGMDGGEDWPELALYAQAAGGVQGLRVAWIDDYGYDFCCDAIREGYRYELLAYTDTEYAYFGVVFTGLPIVTVNMEDAGEITQEYRLARAGVFDAGHDAVHSAAMVHLRGGGYIRDIDKFSYRLEFHTVGDRGRDRKDRIDVLGMGADSDWLLIGNPTDETCVRNHLCWALWKAWNPDGDAPALLESRMVELFINDTYMGLYQLMQRVDIPQELERMGADPDAAYVFRTVRERNIDPARPAGNYKDRADFFAELRYAPAGASGERALDRIEDYVRLNQRFSRIDDAEFDALAGECVDVREMLSYFMFSQAAALTDDNVCNNLYIWRVCQDDGRFVYRLSPWDMDYGLYLRSEALEDGVCVMLEVCYRMVERDTMGSRQIIWDLWQEKRQTILTDDAIYQRISDLEDWINHSGAYLRESARWWGGEKTLDLSHLSEFEISHMNLIDNWLIDVMHAR